MKITEILKLLGAALAGEALINQRYSDFTDTSRIHHAQIGAAMLALGFGPEIIETVQSDTLL